MDMVGELKYVVDRDLVYKHVRRTSTDLAPSSTLCLEIREALPTPQYNFLNSKDEWRLEYKLVNSTVNTHI